MSFELVEKSNDEGRPIYLYQFTLGGNAFRYTSSDADVVMAGYRWQAVAISDDGVKLTGEAVTDGLSITLPSNTAIVQMFAGTPPSEVIMVSIYHYHEGDTNSVLAYVGEVNQVGQPEPGTATISCDTISASMQRDGLRLAWQRNCPYALYDANCGVDKTEHALEFVVYDIINNVVQLQGADDLPNDTLAGGFLEWLHPSRGVEVRGVEMQNASACTMFGLADGLYYGLAVKAYPGCNRTAGTCKDKFNNLDNYGGIPDLPGKSPFDGDPVF